MEQHINHTTPQFNQINLEDQQVEVQLQMRALRRSFARMEAIRNKYNTVEASPSATPYVNNQD